MLSEKSISGHVILRLHLRTTKVTKSTVRLLYWGEISKVLHRSLTLHLRLTKTLINVRL